MYTLINGSQKIGNSNSMNFLNYISEYLEEYNIYDLKKNSYEEILNNIEMSEVILFAFPLYVDSPTSLLIQFLDYIYKDKIKIK